MQTSEFLIQILQRITWLYVWNRLNQKILSLILTKQLKFEVSPGIYLGFLTRQTSKIDESFFKVHRFCPWPIFLFPYATRIWVCGCEFNKKISFKLILSYSCLVDRSWNLKNKKRRGQIFFLRINLITLYFSCTAAWTFFQLHFRSRGQTPRTEKPLVHSRKSLIFCWFVWIWIMGDDEEEQPPNSPPPKSKAVLSRPTINLPPRTSMESFFGGPGFGFGFSPGPMTLVSSFFSDSDDCKSFSQLLAGAMASPVAVPPHAPTALELKGSAGLDSAGLFSPGQVIA